MKVAVIGGGAAGFYAAITHAENYPHHQVYLFEKTGKTLSKLRISGGGRCNVTHACFDDSLLVQHYPRGQKELRSVFSAFSVKDIINWFEGKGIKLKTEQDGRMFPVTDSSETIATCLEETLRQYGVKLIIHCGDIKISKTENSFRIITAQNKEYITDKIIIATGGSPRADAYHWLHKFEHTIIPPVSSLFTFNLKNHPLQDLPGISLPDITIEIEGSKQKQSGAFIITHWGISGPAVLKLSAWAARDLAKMNYRFFVKLNLYPKLKEEELRETIHTFKEENKQKHILTINPFGFPSRLWQWLCNYSMIFTEMKWVDLPNKSFNRLIENIIRLRLEVEGKSTFKEEFVTCGGVSLKEVNFKTMESKKCKGLYFAGEVLDIDAITGGFNFQAAWSTGYLAGISSGLREE